MFVPDLFPDPANPRPDVLCEECFLSAFEDASLFAWCEQRVVWETRSMRFYDKEVLVPRQLAWFGDKPYTYSGLTHAAAAMPAPLRALADRIELWMVKQGHPARFNSVMLNHYRDGRDSISMHADDEADLGPTPTIASISLGATRTFVLQHKATRVKLSEPLRGGSLLVMKGDTQQQWLHGIPKEAAAGPRINLTYRWTRPQA